MPDEQEPPASPATRAILAAILLVLASVAGLAIAVRSIAPVLGLVAACGVLAAVAFAITLTGRRPLLVLVGLIARVLRPGRRR